MHAIRAPRAFDGERFREGGATVVIEDGAIVGMEAYDHALPEGFLVTTHQGTLLPGLIEAHTHLVTDSGVAALDRVGGYTAGPARRGRHDRPRPGRPPLQRRRTARPSAPRPGRRTDDRGLRAAADHGRWPLPLHGR